MNLSSPLAFLPVACCLPTAALRAQKVFTAPKASRHTPTRMRLSATAAFSAVLALAACQTGPAGAGDDDAFAGDTVVLPLPTTDIVTPPPPPPTPEEPVLPDDPEVQAPPTGPTYAACFSDISSESGQAPDYDQFGPTVGSHCSGTNHQDIRGIERVVFLGDSVTVGTPPTVASETYRSRLAALLAAHFHIEAPSAIWERFNLTEGTALMQQSGAFWSCARWGARNDDLNEDNSQIDDCFPASERGKKTLVIITMGGNDIADFTKDGLEGKPLDEIRADVERAAALLDQGIHRLKNRALFPAGNDVIFANPPEFTDGTGDVGSCPSASIAGYDRNWDDPQAQATLVVYLLEQYMRVAVETGSDLVFFLENFCGHGYHNTDADAACYRGPDTERWFDLTCTHPNPTGHRELAQMFFNIVLE